MGVLKCCGKYCSGLLAAGIVYFLVLILFARSHDSYLQFESKTSPDDKVSTLQSAILVKLFF
jgi:hypothetical protein